MTVCSGLDGCHCHSFSAISSLQYSQLQLNKAIARNLWVGCSGLDMPSVHLACKKLSGGVLAWLSVWSEVQTCIWPSWCHCHSLSLASVKSRLVLPFWYWLTRVVLDNGLLNGCVCVCVCACACACACVCVVGWTGAYGELAVKRPSGSLVTPSSITTLLVHVALVIAVQAATFLYLQAQPWSASISLCCCPLSLWMTIGVNAAKVAGVATPLNIWPAGVVLC